MMPLLIDGAWVTTAHAEENRNPSNTNDVIDLYAHAGRAETQAAIEAAARAVPAWASTTPQFRFDILNRVADQVIGRKTEIGTLLSREEGKTLREGIAETERAANIFRFSPANAFGKPANFFRPSAPVCRLKSRVSHLVLSGSSRPGISRWRYHPGRLPRRFAMATPWSSSQLNLSQDVHGCWLTSFKVLEFQRVFSTWSPGRDQLLEIRSSKLKMLKPSPLPVLRAWALTSRRLASGICASCSWKWVGKTPCRA